MRFSALSCPHHNRPAPSRCTLQAIQSSFVSLSTTNSRNACSDRGVLSRRSRTQISAGVCSQLRHTTIGLHTGALQTRSTHANGTVHSSHPDPQRPADRTAPTLRMWTRSDIPDPQRLCCLRQGALTFTPQHEATRSDHSAIARRHNDYPHLRQRGLQDRAATLQICRACADRMVPARITHPIHSACANRTAAQRHATSAAPMLTSRQRNDTPDPSCPRSSHGTVKVQVRSSGADRARQHTDTQQQTRTDTRGGDASEGCRQRVPQTAAGARQTGALPALPAPQQPRQQVR